MTGILGCDPLRAVGVPRRDPAALAAVDVLVHAEIQRRQEARERRDWAEATDGPAEEGGRRVTDTADGPQWTLMDGYST